MRLLCFMYMLVCIASALFYVYACMLGCMYVCELGGSFAGGCPSLAYTNFSCVFFLRHQVVTSSVCLTGHFLRRCATLAVKGDLGKVLASL